MKYDKNLQSVDKREVLIYRSLLDQQYPRALGLWAFHLP